MSGHQRHILAWSDPHTFELGFSRSEITKAVEIQII